MSMYEELIDEGSKIEDLLRANSGNVGDIGELLHIAADELERLYSLNKTLFDMLSETLKTVEESQNDN
jgi:hypothetical protein